VNLRIINSKRVLRVIIAQYLDLTYRASLRDPSAPTGASRRSR
jgi:hypothetical protein